ncbi:MAG: hypothetical protein ABIG44_03975 [Planctomycetota bacterium]
MASGSETVLKVRGRRNGAAAPTAVSREKVEALRELTKVASAQPLARIRDVARNIAEYAGRPRDEDMRHTAIGLVVTMLHRFSTEELCDLVEELVIILSPGAPQATDGTNGNGRE